MSGKTVIGRQEGVIHPIRPGSRSLMSAQTHSRRISIRDPPHLSRSCAVTTIKPPL